VVAAALAGVGAYAGGRVNEKKKKESLRKQINLELVPEGNCKKVKRQVSSIAKSKSESGVGWRWKIFQWWWCK
jgi:hypothetical protein